MRKKKIYRNPVSTSKYTGLFLISPFLIGFTVFILYPFISSFVISLYDCKMNLEPDFIGLGNYKEKKLYVAFNFDNAETSQLQSECCQHKRW